MYHLSSLNKDYVWLGTLQDVTMYAPPQVRDTMAEDCEPQVSAVVHTHSVRSSTHKTAQRLAFSDGIKMMSSLPAEDTLELVKYDFL